MCIQVEWFIVRSSSSLVCWIQTSSQDHIYYTCSMYEEIHRARHVVLAPAAVRATVQEHAGKRSKFKDLEAICPCTSFLENLCIFSRLLEMPPSPLLNDYKCAFLASLQTIQLYWCYLATSIYMDTPAPAH